MSLHRKYRPGAGGIHQPCYFGSTDPATLYLVEAGHVWIDDATDPTLVTMKKRNDANTAWTTVMTSAAVGVRGPSVAVDGNVPQFDGTTGAKLKDGGLSIDTDVALAANSNSRLVPQATIKSYIATLLQGLKPKDAVLCASTANLTLSGEQTIDGVLTSASRVLVKNQTAPAENGIYVTAAGAWTRATDNDAWTEIVGGFVFVEEGSALADTGWMCTSDPAGTLGTTAINWTQYSGVGAYQPLAAVLTALTSLASTLGLLEQTSAGVFGIRALGVGASTSVPTRADADARFAALSHTHAAADIVSGLLALARGGVNADLSGTGPGWMRQASAGAAATVRELLSTDLPAGSIVNVAPAGLVAGYHHRYSAAAVHSGLADGDPVTTFDDIGSVGAALTTLLGTTDRPTYKLDGDGDGLPAVWWDGVNDGMRVRALTAYTGVDLAVFGVIRNVTNIAGNLIRLDDQSHGALTVQNATVSWATSGNATVNNRNGGAVSARPNLSSATGIGGADFRGSWMVFALIWGAVQGLYIMRYYENHYQMSSPAIASSAFAWNRIALGASPNDSTDAWVGGTFNALALRELVIYKAATFASREDLVKQNLQYLATACKVAAWL